MMTLSCIFSANKNIPFLFPDIIMIRTSSTKQQANGMCIALSVTFRICQDTPRKSCLRLAIPNHRKIKMMSDRQIRSQSDVASKTFVILTHQRDSPKSVMECSFKSCGKQCFVDRRYQLQCTASGCCKKFNSWI